MTVGQRLLEGDIVDPQAQRITSLEAELRQARRAASDAEIEADRAREDANRALSMLRRQLGPLYQALKAVFGELDAAGVADESSSTPTTSSAPDGRESAVWKAWKDRLGENCSKVIDALLIHSDLDVQQLAIAIGLTRQSMPKILGKMNKAGLLRKEGRRYSLKKL